MRPAIATSLTVLAFALTACSAAPAADSAPLRVASLQGPTTMGLVHLIDQSDHQSAAQPYDFTIVGTPDAISASLVAGNLDIALIPVNLAAVLYNKTDGGVKLAAVNTLGVLYIVSGDPAVTQLSDLAGRTVLSTGRGTTPQFVLDKVLSSSGLTSQVTVDYRSQATEVASVLAVTPSDIAVLPEPYVTVSMAANPDIHIVADLNDAWLQATGSSLVTGCVAVRTAFADQHPASVAVFLTEYAASVAFTNDHPDEVAPLIVAKNLAPSASVAVQAIPRAHIVYLTGDDAKQAVSAYLNVLWAADPSSVGGAVPDGSFYYNT